ncbi:MAG: hypothetical protein ABI772_14845 [Bacteroidota bacterium]
MKFTKHIFFILLAIVLTVPKDVLHFVVGIPAILHHFKHHNEEHGQISFIDFINEHASGTDLHHDRDDHEHDNLPFNHQHTSDCNPTLTYIPFFHSINLKIQFPLSSQVKIVTKQFFPGSEFFKSVWQPPKIS